MLRQTATFDAIAKQHPDLAKQAISLKTSFDAKLGLPEKRASWFLEGVLGENEFTKFIED